MRSLKRVDNSEKIDLKKKADLLVAKHKENEILTEKIQEIEASHREVRRGTSHIGLVVSPCTLTIYFVCPISELGVQYM